MAAPVIHSASLRQTQEIAALTKQLWPDCHLDELVETIQASLANTDEQIIVATHNSTIIGVVLVGLRRDYVEGAETSPVGYIEGVFVVPGYRTSGVGRELLRAAEEWCAEKGCTEMGSDTEVDNEVSQKFHQQCGYFVASHIVHFIKPIQKK